MEVHTVQYITHPSPMSMPGYHSQPEGPAVLQSTVITGEALTVLSTLPSGCVQAAVTSPPYWSLRDYGIPGQIGLENDPATFVNTLVQMFDEVRRV